MAVTLDNIYDRLGKLIDAVNNTGGLGGEGRRIGNSVRIPNYSDIDDVIENISKRLNSLSDNLDEYNTTFEKDILENQQKNAKELDKLQKEYLDRFEKFKKRHEDEYKKYADEIQKATKILEDTNASFEDKKQAKKDIEQNQRGIDRLDNQFNNQKTTQKQLNNISSKRNEIREDEEDVQRFRHKSRVGKNVTKAQDYGKQMQSIGKSIGGKFGGGVAKADAGLTKFAGALGKAVPVIGWVITTLQLLGDAAKAVAKADAGLQDIQNERNTARTNRNIERSKLDAESLVDRLETATANGLQTLQTEGSIALGQQQIDNQERMNQLQTRNDSITNGFNSTAWESLNRDIDVNAAKAKLSVMAKTERGKTERANALRDLKLSGREQVRQIDAKLIDQDLREKETELDKRDRDHTREQPFATTATRIAGSSTNADNVYNPGGTDYGEVESANSTNIGVAATMGAIESIPLVGGLVSSFTDAAYTKADTLAKQKLVNERNQLNSQKALIENTTSLSNAMMSSTNQISDTTADLYKDIYDNMIDAQAEQQKTMVQFSQKIERWAMNFDKLMRNSAASKGITTREQNSKYGQFMNQTTQTLAHNWGLKAEEVMQMQDNYGANTGRSIIANGTDMNKTAAMGKYLGDNNLAVNLANSTEIFNMGMSTTMDLMWDMSKKVTKMGLDGRKYMKDMVGNLKLAQKYQFKDGVKGMMEMAKWAQNTRFNMNNFSNMLEKIQDGGLENLITTGAGMQVLGGGFAMGADPLAMGWEAFNDPAALAKRQSDMMKGIGRMDSKTGEVVFNMEDQMRLRQFAKLTGQDYEDLLNQRRQSVKGAKMGDLVDSGLDDEQRANVINKAYYKDGEWMVNDMEGEPHKVSDINSDNIGIVQADTHEGVVERALQHIVSYVDKEQGLSEEEMAKFADAITSLGTLEENQQARYEAQEDFFEGHFGENLSTIISDITSATNSFAQKLHEDTKDPIQAATAAINTVNNTLNSISGKIDEIKNKIEASNKSSGSSGDVGAEAAWAWFLDESNDRNIADVKKKLQKLKDSGLDGEALIKKAKEIGAFTEGYDDLLDAMENVGYINDDSESYLTASNIKAMIAAAGIEDGVVSGKGKSMTVAASKVTPINDGEVATTNPNDHAIFAKSGGPFDTLFNGVFDRINTIYNGMMEPRAYDPFEGLTVKDMPIIGGLLGNKSNGDNVKFDTIKVEMSGSIELKSNNQEINIIEELKNNQLLLREVTKLISDKISQTLNGGRGIYNGGDIVSFRN